MPNFNGTAGDDIFTGGGDSDTLVGNGGNDTLSGGGGNDLLVGGAGADTLNGGDGDDRLYSGEESPPFNLPYYGNTWTPPVLDTGTERDTLNGGAGSDRIFAGYGDNVDGGDGGSYGDYLYISFMGSTSGVVADFRQKTQVIGGGTITDIESVSWVEGSNYDDDINVGGSSNGYSDFTAVFGMGGNDKLVAGYYTGVLYGGDGNDIVDGRNSQYLQRVDGGAGDDTLYTNSNTFAEAYGGDGNDKIYAHGVTHGGAGNDTIVMQVSYYGGWVYGEAGDDDIQAASSGNMIAGGAGADKLYGDAGADMIYSAERDPNSNGALDDMGLERDVIAGFGGADTLAAGYGDDVDGGSGVDTLRLSLGGATSGVTFDTAGIVSGQPFTYAGGTISNVEKLVYLRGSEFADTLVVATQGELLSVDAGAGDDVITTKGSSASVKGGAGDDRLVSGQAGDIFDGGAGFDTVDYSAYAAAVTVSLIAGTGAGGDQLSNVEAVIGSAFADALTGDTGANTLRGGGGNDTLDGGAGTDTAEYLGSSKDYSWTQGSDGSWTVKDLRGGAPDGVDTLKSIERLKFSDTLVQLPTAPVTNIINGTSGSDTLVATSANDIIDGGAGTDTVEFRGASTDFSWTQGSDSSWTVKDLRSGSPEGTDTLKNVEQLKFTDKLVVLTPPASNVIQGTSGSDNLRGTSGNDIMRGGGDTDFLYGSLGDDVLDGGEDYDYATFISSTQGVRVDLAITTAQDTGEGRDTFISIDALLGSAYDDVLYGDGNSNVLNGYNGDDQLDGRAGNDSIGGDAGNDIVHGGAGDDNVGGGSGNDFVYGDAGNDIIVLASENAAYGMGNDFVDGGDGVDTLWIPSANFGVSINLSIASQQQIAPGVTLTVQNIENLTGGGYADTLTGDAGVNALYGGGGNDALDGGAGTDTAEYVGASTSYSWTQGSDGSWTVRDLRAGNPDGVDTLKNIEWLKFSDKLVQLTTAPVTNVINGASGNDTLVATSANDIIDGGAGTDTVELRGASTDFSWTQGSDGSWTVKDLRSGAPEGTDTLKNVEQLKFTDKLVVLTVPAANVVLGTSNSDNLYGAPNDDIMRGGGSDDFLWSSPGNDTYDGGDGRDWVEFGNSKQGVRVDLAISGPQNTGEGNDTFESIEALSGSTYNDVLYGDDGANGLSGYDGDDQLDGRAGNDSIGGDAGNDVIHGGAGNDNLSGGSGNDFVYGDAGDDRITLQSETTDRTLGNDYIDGGDGFDAVWVTYVNFGVSINLSTTTEQQIGGGFTLTIKNVERLEGWQFADKLTGNAGDNQFVGWNGDDIIDGGGGVDTVIMRGYSTDYAVTWTPNGWQIADKRPYVAPSQVGASSIYDGVDIVKNVEFIEYYDKTVALGDGMTFVTGNILRQAGASTTASDLSSRLASGAINATQAVAELVTKAGATTSVATLAYEFFTGKIPGQSGIDYLVSPTGPNASSLNSAYYQKFNLENRYINFAVNLGKVGEGAASFTAKYGALSLFDATREAYKTIFGAAPTDAKIHALIDTRVDYFTTFGGDGPNGIGTKAAMVGWLLAEAQKADLGVMVRSNDAWLTDLADGSAPFAIDILDPAKGYWKADFVFGGQ